jgi:hypothetical protein
MRNISVAAQGGAAQGAIFQILPKPVVPSPVQRFAFKSKASPFVPGTPFVNSVAVGGVLELGFKRQIFPPDAASAMYAKPSLPKAIPEGLQLAGLGINPTTTNEGESRLILQTGQGLGDAALPVVYKFRRESPAKPSIANGVTIRVEKVGLCGNNEEISPVPRDPKAKTKRSVKKRNRFDLILLPSCAPMT